MKVGEANESSQFHNIFFLIFFLSKICLGSSIFSDVFSDTRYASDDHVAAHQPSSTMTCTCFLSGTRARTHGLRWALEPHGRTGSKLGFEGKKGKKRGFKSFLRDSLKIGAPPTTMDGNDVE